MQERSIIVMEMSREQERTNRQISESETQFADLNQTISDQTMGITSLSDVFKQLREAGATTSQILQIFGVRGGSTRLTQSWLKEMRLNDLLNSMKMQGTTQRFADTMKTTTANALAELNSALTAFMIDVGEQFGPALREDIILALIDFIKAMQPLIPEFAEIAKVMAKELPNIIEAFIPILLHMGRALWGYRVCRRRAGPHLPILGVFHGTVLELLGGIGKMFDSIINGDVQGFFEGLLQVFESLAFILKFSILRVLNAVGKMTGLICRRGWRNGWSRKHLVFSKVPPSVEWLVVRSGPVSLSVVYRILRWRWNCWTGYARCRWWGWSGSNHSVRWIAFFVGWSKSCPWPANING